MRIRESNQDGRRNPPRQSPVDRAHWPIAAKPRAARATQSCPACMQLPSGPNLDAEDDMSTTDLHGLALTTGIARDGAGPSIMRWTAIWPYRADAPQAPAPAPGGRPASSASGHVLKGYFSDALLQSRPTWPAAREALETARRLSAGATWREQAHVAALAHWIDGDIDATLANLGGDPRRASARCAGVSPASLPRLLARPP